MLKNSIGAYPSALGFSFKPLYPTGVMLDWQTEAPKTYRAPTQKSECQEWLEDFLKANPDGLPPRDIVEAGEEAGFKRAMIYEIRKHLNAQIQNTAGRQSPGNCWKWCETPPEISQQEDDD